MATRFKACSVDGCNGNADRITARGSKGFCANHYARFRRSGNPTAGRPSYGAPIVQVRNCAGCGKTLPVPKNWSRTSRWKRQRPVQCRSCQSLRHGKSRTRLYRIWMGMLTRCGHRKCSNPSAIKYYIDRGISVCPEWHDFATFTAWAESNGYADDLTIDRIDAGRGYEPDNCRWLTMADNLRHRHGTLEAAA